MIDDDRSEDAASKKEQKNLLIVPKLEEHTLKRASDQIFFSKLGGRVLSQPQEWGKDIHENLHLY